MFDVNFNNSIRHVLLSIIVFQSKIQRTLHLAHRSASSKVYIKDEISLAKMLHSLNFPSFGF